MKWAFILVIHLCMLAQLAAQEKKVLKSPKNISTDNLWSDGPIILKAKEIGKQDTTAADNLFRIAITKAIDAGDPYNAGKAYYEMGEMYFHHRNHNKSFGAFINAKEYFVKSGSEKMTAYANFAIGRQQYYRGNYKLAAGHLTYAMRLSKQLKLKSLEANVLEYLGILYHVMPNTGHHSTALLQKSLSIKQQLNDQNGELQIREKLSGIYYDEQKFDSALYYGQSSVILAEKLGLNYDANLSRLSQVASLLRLGKLVEAKEKIHFIKTDVLDSSDLNMRIRYYIQAGNYNMALQDTMIAQKKYDTALLIAQNSGFPEMYSLVYKNMAGAYYYNNDFKKAFEYQMEYTRKMAGLYSEENFTTFKELEYILKTNITEDEVKYLSIQNEIKEVRLKNEKTLRLILLASAAGLLLSAAAIFFLYRRQKTKNRIIEKQDDDLQTLMKEIHHRVKNNLQQNENKDELLLEVKDDGDGFPQGLNIYRTESFGYKLVKAFAHKLKARLEVFNDNGACVQLHIRKFKNSS